MEREHQHRHLIHRDQLDDLNEYYVRHHMERERAKAGWPIAVFVWGVVFGSLAWLNGEDVFFPSYYFFIAWFVLCVVSRILVGFDRGVRVH